MTGPTDGGGKRRQTTVKKREAIYAMFCAAAEAGLPAPLDREIARALHCAQGGMTALIAELKNQGRIRSHVYRGPKWGKGRIRIVEIVATGKKTAPPQQSAPQAHDPAAAGSNSAAAAIANNIELPSDGQSNAKEAGAAQLPPASCQTEPAADEAGQPSRRPVSLRALDRTGWIKHVNGDLTPRAINTALTAKDRCQYIIKTRWPVAYCGAERDAGNNPQNPYCKAHAAECGGGFYNRMMRPIDVAIRGVAKQRHKIVAI